MNRDGDGYSDYKVIEHDVEVYLAYFSLFISQARLIASFMLLEKIQMNNYRKRTYVFPTDSFQINNAIN